jgi:predicted HTH transcriptional regulator
VDKIELFEMTPVPRSIPDDLNETLLIEYFRQVRNIGYDDKSKWLRLLMDNQILSEELGDVNCTLAGLILFGKKDRMKSGARYHRNQMIVDYLRDMEYIESNSFELPRSISIEIKQKYISSG